MTLPPGKMRTRAHVLADLSINYVERQVLLCGFSVDRVHRLSAELFAGGETVNVHIPTGNRLNLHEIRAIARHKNDLPKQLRGKGLPHA